jgi:hypothetical protein
LLTAIDCWLNIFQRLNEEQFISFTGEPKVINFINRDYCNDYTAHYFKLEIDIFRHSNDNLRIPAHIDNLSTLQIYDHE